MISKHLAALALAALASGAAQAGGRPDVQWSVTIGSPHVGVMVGEPIYAPRVYAEPVYERYVYAPRYYYPQPVVVVPLRGVHRSGWRGSYRDGDHDGVPSRYDHVHHPRWDRDGDGIPNRYDRHEGYDRHERHERNPYRR